MNVRPLVFGGYMLKILNFLNNSLKNKKTTNLKYMIQNIPIKNLKLLEKNPRRITKEQMEKLCQSIKNDPEFLQCRPVLVNCVTVGDPSKQIMHVYAGNQRVRAAKKLGMKEIPCIVKYELDEATVKKRIIQDNKTYGEFDFDVLANLWDIEILIDCGFIAEEILGDLSNISDDERVQDDKPKNEKTCPHCGEVL